MKLFLNLFFFIFTINLLMLVSGEVFTAMSELYPLIATEGQVAKTLEKYLRIEEERIASLKRLCKQYTRLHDAASNDSDAFLSNPLNAYLLVKSLTKDWKKASRLIEGAYGKAVIENLGMQQLPFPEDEDSSGAAHALVRLQYMYKLDTESLARGEIEGARKSAELTASDCYELGIQAYHLEDYAMTMKWMQEANRRIHQEQPASVSYSEILEHMAYSAFLTGNITYALDLTEELISKDPEHPRAYGNLINFKSYLKEGAQAPPTTAQPEYDSAWEGYEIYENYKKLCRGEKTRSEKEESKLKCYYSTRGNPYLMLMPTKVEQINLVPPLYQFHDILVDWEADVLREISKPLLTRAVVQNFKSGEQLTAPYRISKSAWLPVDDLSLKLGKRIEEITGLSSQWSEALHVLNYGIGGHYEPHYDYSESGSGGVFAHMGNRLATWIFYLSDVDAGGATVFPVIGARVVPRKGSASFWYNLHENGEGDDRTQHAACPVLAGSKWVANKWLHEFGNEFRRKCRAT